MNVKTTVELVVPNDEKYGKVDLFDLGQFVERLENLKGNSDQFEVKIELRSFSGDDDFDSDNNAIVATWNG